MKRSSFIFHKEWEEPLSMLDSADQGRVMMAMIRYDNGETVDLSDSPTAAMAFAFIRTRMDEDREKWEETCEKRSEAGRKAAEARWDANDAKRIKRNVDDANVCERINRNAKNASDADTDTDTDTDNDIKEKESPKGDSKKKAPAPKKNQYGVFKNVLLTDDEYHKLREKYVDFADRIERLSGYIESTGKRYKSHYATILNWARRDEEQKPRGKPADGTRGDYTLEAFEKRRAEHPEDEGIYEVF